MDVHGAWPAKSSHNPVDAEPIGCRLMALPGPAGCNTAWDRTRGCSDCSALQCSALVRCATRKAKGVFEHTHSVWLAASQNEAC